MMVLLLGLGMRPLGPRTRARGAIKGMSAGLARRISKSILPDLILSPSSGVKIATRVSLPIE